MITRHLGRIRDQPVGEREVDRAFASYGHYWLEAFRLPNVPTPALEAAMCYEGIDNLERARALGKGALLAMPHVGAWDWGGAWLAASGFPLTVVAEVVEPVELAEWFARWRRRVGMNVVPLDGAAGAGVSAALRRGEVVGLLCDRDLAGDGVEVEFFGERTRLPAGPALLALRTGAPLMACCVLFEGDHHRGIILPPLDTARRDGLRRDVERITQDMADALASLVRRAPEQWHVFQPNWPSDRQVANSSQVARGSQVDIGSQLASGSQLHRSATTGTAVDPGKSG
jgi:KDO2-lipid IV(A) lauroyltransferase